MLVLVIPQFFFFFFFFLNLRLHNIIPGIIKRLFLNKLAGFSKVSRNPIPYPGRKRNWSEHWWLHAMPSKLENTLPLFVSVRKWVGSVLTSGLTFNFTQVKVKGRHASQSELYILKKLSSLKNVIVKLALL